LTQALALGEAEGYLHVFVDEGAALLERLLDAPPDLRQQPYVRRILAAFGPVQAAARTNLIEPLTERESEVLRLLAEGLSYAAIAGRLVVSVNTVRYHVKGLYGKLSVEKQSQAVQRARDLGLL
jgi:LuxR family maltose regulon positive regulatory protein